MEFACEQVARAALGEPAKRAGRELLWRCPRHDDVHPSLQVNPRKNVWLCGPCDASGTAWQLAAFLSGCDPADKEAVSDWLCEHGLLNGSRRKRKVKAQKRGPAVAEFVHPDANGNAVCKKVRHEPGANGRDKDYTWQHLENGAWKPGLGDPPIIPPLYNLPAILGNDLIFLFESHTDAERAIRMGLTATTSGGLNSWRPEYADTLAGKDVCWFPTTIIRALDTRPPSANHYREK